MSSAPLPPLVFFFNDTATTEIYTLSLHDALPISPRRCNQAIRGRALPPGKPRAPPARKEYADRKSTRLNSSHQIISYAVFCLKKKTHITTEPPPFAGTAPFAAAPSSARGSERRHA